MFPQRWNRLGQRTIYAAESLAVAQLELLVHLDRARPPRDHVYWEIVIPDGVSVEWLDPARLPRWHYRESPSAKKFGGEWFASHRSCVLVVPSKAAPGGRNVLLNPEHPDYSHVVTRLRGPVQWDERLFG